MTGNDCIMYAFELDGSGRGLPLIGEDIARKIKEDTLAWAHFRADHLGTRDWLMENASYLDPLILDALLADETRPRVTEYPDGYLVILRGVNLNDNEDEEDMISIRMWIDQHRIISTRRRKLAAIQNIRERLEMGNGPKNSADFITMLLSKLNDNMEPVLMALDDQTDILEETVLENPDKHYRKNINDLRRKCIMLRRYISPQKEAVAHLRSSTVPWLEPRHMRIVQENQDRLTRYVEDLDSMRERGQIIKDELANALSDRMNKNLYVLSLISALFLPLGFLTGLFGINVGGMPGVDSQHAFWIVSALCAAVMVVEYMLFRLMRWL
jgi:zinc transporter